MQFDPTSDWVSEASIAPAEVMLKNKDPLILCTYVSNRLFICLNRYYLFNEDEQQLIYHKLDRPPGKVWPF